MPEKRTPILVQWFEPNGCLTTAQGHIVHREIQVEYKRAIHASYYCIERFYSVLYSSITVSSSNIILNINLQSFIF